MNISRIQNFNTSFCSHNSNIRKINDIQRKANQEFPMFSPSYAHYFYTILNPKQKTTENTKAEAIVESRNNELRLLREKEAEDEKARNKYLKCKELPYLRTIDRIRSRKLGNCDEAAIATMSVLAANGIHDAKLVCLGFKTDFINKETKKVEYSSFTPIDHVCCVTAMNKENPQEKDYIIADAWYGFTADISEAREKYSKIFDTTLKSEDVDYAFSMFRLKKLQEAGLLIDKNNYTIRKKFSFQQADKTTEEDMKQLGSFIKMLNPNLCK